MGSGRWDDDGRRDQGRSPRSRHVDDDPRQGRAGSRDGGSSGWDRSSRDGSRYPRRDVDDGGRGGSYNRGGRAGSSNRGGWDDPRGSRGGSPDRSGDRSARGGRPPVRDDWDAPSRGRGAGGPGYSGSGRRPPQQGGGLWGDEPRGRPPMRDPRDPRAARAGGRRPMAPEPEEGEFSFGRSAGIIGGMFLLGVGIAFLYFMLSRPTPQLDNTPTVPTNTVPAATPSTAPNVTPSPSGFAPGAGPAYVVVDAGAIG